MAEPVPPSMSTPTFGALIAMWWEVAIPIVQWGLAWVQAHTMIVFPPGYELVLKIAISGSLMFAAVRWHMGPASTK